MKRWWRCGFCESWVGEFHSECNNCGASRRREGEDFVRIGPIHSDAFGGSYQSWSFPTCVRSSYSSCQEVE